MTENDTSFVTTTGVDAHAVKCPVCRRKVDVLISVRDIEKFIDELTSGEVVGSFCALSNIFHAALKDGRQKVYVFDLKRHRMYK